MKKITVFYFTGTGNTKYISDYFAKCMTSINWEANSISIENLDLKDRNRYLEESDVIFLAYPIYCSEMPSNMADFIDKLPNGKGKSLGVFCSQLMFSGDGSSIMKKRIKELGYNQIWGFQFNMFNNLCIKGSPLKQTENYKELEKKLEKVNLKIESMAESVNINRKRVYDGSIVHNLMGLLQRPAYNKKLRAGYQHAFSANDKCVKCQKCIRSCPGKVIELIDDQVVFKNNDNCVTCFRCYNFCPVSGVNYKGNVQEPLFKSPTKEIYNDLFK